MKITHSMLIMFIGSFIVQYFVMPPIMVNKFIYITNNIGKAYLATIMGLFMVLIEVMMHDHQYNIMSYKYYAVYGILIILFIITSWKNIL